MIKFFRRIRRSLLSENKFNKYLLYATGEIILVVIGILIALQINTWNEQRKNNIKISSFFEEVQTNLLKDISNIEYAISNYKLQDSLAYLVLNDKLIKEDYKKPGAQDLFRLITTFEDFRFNNNGYENLKLNVNNIPYSYKPIFDTLTNLHEQTKRNLENQNIRIGNAVYANIKYLSDNKEWFSSNYGSWASNDTIIEYFLHDPFYKNRVKEFQILIVDSFKTYKIDAIRLYEQLDVITKSGKPLPEHLKTYIDSAKSLKPFIGVYRAADTFQNEIKINEEGFFHNNYPFNLINEGNGIYSFEYSYNRSVAFQKDDEGELTGLNIYYYDKKIAYSKVE